MSRLNIFVQKLWRQAESTNPNLDFCGLRKIWIELESHGLYVPDDYIGSFISATKSHEPHVTKIIQRELESGEVFVDVGANIGFFTMLASRIVGETGKIISFEPNPFNLQLIYSSILRNTAGNIRVYPYAASDSPRILRFFTIGSNGGVITPADKRETAMLVQGIALDEMLKDEKRVSLVKLDIEGHEASAVKGMVNVITRHKPKIITEFHPWAMRLNNEVGEPQEYLDLLVDLGYELSIVEQTGELTQMSSSTEVMSYQASLQKSLGDERIHVDLFARPIGG